LKRLRARLDPLDLRAARGPERGGDRQHPRIYVQGRDAPSGTDRLCRQPRDNSGPARDVENACSRPQSRELHHPRGPRLKDRRHQLALVRLGRGARNLPVLALGHAFAAGDYTPARVFATAEDAGTAP
jgi:hypothetical protein